MERPWHPGVWPAACITASFIVVSATGAWAAPATTAGAAVDAATPVAPTPNDASMPAPPSRATWLTPENLRWGLRHAREVVPTATVLHAERVRPLPAGQALPTERLRLRLTDGQQFSLADYLRDNHVDGLLVLHRGRVVHEHYAGDMRPRDVHSWASMSKSLVGIVAQQLASAGRLDLNAPLDRYVPALAGTPFGSATVQQNLDMQVALAYPKELPPDIGMFVAAGLLPPRPGTPLSIHDFIRVPRPVDEASGSQFFYQNGSTEAVAWALERVTGQRLPELISTLIWQPMGAADPAYYPLDAAGSAFASGGLHSTLRDAARMGEWVRTRGRLGDRPTEATAALERIHQAPDADNQARVARAGRAMPGGTAYANFWWYPARAPGALVASGRFGQRLYIDHRHELVIAQFGSYADLRPRAVAVGQVSPRQDHLLRTDDGLVALAQAIVALVEHR